MLQGKTANVTGLSSGIGLGIAETFARSFRHALRYVRPPMRAASAYHLQVTSMRRVLGMLLVTSTATLLFMQPVRAADAGKLIETMTNEIIEIGKTKVGADRQFSMRRVVQDNFDLPYIGRSALGTRWNQVSEQQRARFLAAVEVSEARVYSERLGKYAGYRVVIGKVTSRPNSVWIVESRLDQTGGQPVRIDWEVHESGHGLRVADVKVEGISLSLIMRSDFNSYILSSFGEVEPLVRELEARAAPR